MEHLVLYCINLSFWEIYKGDNGVFLSSILSRILSKSLHVSLKFLVCFLESILLRKNPYCLSGLPRSPLPGYIAESHFLAFCQLGVAMF